MADYTVAMLRGTRSTDGLLWAWGVAMREGYAPARAPADPDRPRLAATFASRPPLPEALLDLSRAFAALHPGTRGLGNAGGLAWFASAPDISRHQLVIYLYYVESLGSLALREAVKRLPRERRATFLDLLDQFRKSDPRAPEWDDADGDALVARRIPSLRGPGHISPQRANDLRNDAIRRMVTFLNARPALLQRTA